MPAISIIVPVYKEEAYLQRCVDRILAQTFHDFELILVDDGSPDGCPAICDAYAQQDSRIHVIHQINSGAANARNTGLKHASGPFIAFCDSDDIVAPRWLEHMMEYMDHTKVTLPMCAYCQEESQLGLEKLCTHKPGFRYPAAEYFQFNSEYLAGYLCNALYRRDIIEKNGLCMREQKQNGDYNEDLIFAVTYAKHADEIVYTGFMDYCYCYHADSLSHGNTSFYFCKYEEKFRIWDDFLQEKTDPMQYEPNLRKLSCEYLYHYLCSISTTAQLSHNIRANYRILENIVCHPTVQKCITYADTSQENGNEISLIKQQKVFSIWIRYRIHHLKERLLS